MTKYCPRITDLSIGIWHYMSNVFRYKLKVAEIGMTNHLIFDITNFYSGFHSGCEVFCYHAKNEKQRGADIDLYIQNANGRYQHYMIQAKVMDFRGYYNDIAKWNPNAQFLTLIKKAKKEKALALYLLYNGFTSKSRLCNPALGTAIIEANEIRKFRTSQRRTGYLHGQNSLYFDLLFNKMQPYQNLFCKGIQDVKLPQSKAENEIYTGFPYTKIIENSNNEDISDEESLEEDQQAIAIIEEMSLAPVRIIVKYDSEINNVA
jgi:hypothetical protein